MLNNNHNYTAINIMQDDNIAYWICKVINELLFDSPANTFAN